MSAWALGGPDRFSFTRFVNRRRDDGLDLYVAARVTFPTRMRHARIWLKGWVQTLRYQGVK